MEYSLGIDIGGTNIAAGVVDESFNIVSKSKVKTNSARGYEEVLRGIALAGELAVKDAGLSMEKIKWVGMGCPGTCNIDSGIVEYANNLKWENVPLRRFVGDALGIPAYIENDANAAA